MMTNENKSVKRPSLRHFVPHIPSSFYYFLRRLLSCVVSHILCLSFIRLCFFFWYFSIFHSPFSFLVLITHSFIHSSRLSFLGNCPNHPGPGRSSVIFPQFRLRLLSTTLQTVLPFTREILRLTKGNPRPIHKRTCFHNKCLLLQLPSLEDFSVTAAPSYLSSQSHVTRK